MTYAVVDSAFLADNPLDVVEQVVAGQGWLFDRSGDDEIAAEAPVSGSVYRLWFAWCPERAALHFASAFEIRVPGNRRAALFELLAMVNERQWTGHFDAVPDQGMMVFRQSLPLRGGCGIDVAQMQDLVDAAIASCESYYPAFQYVIWGGKAPAEAMAAVLLETVGEA